MKLYLEIKALIVDVTPEDAVIRVGKFEWYFTSPAYDEKDRTVLGMLKPQVLPERMLHNK